MKTIKFLVAAILALTLDFPMTGAQFHLPALNVASSCGPISVLNNRDLGVCMVENDALLWYSNTFPNSSTIYISEDMPMRFESNTAAWDSICGWASTVADCIATKLPQCSASIGDELFNNYLAYQLFFGIQFDYFQGESSWLNFTRYTSSWNILLDFYRRSCSRQRVKPQIQLLLDDPEFDPSFHCISGIPRRNMYRCAQSMVDQFVLEGVSFNPATLILQYTNLIRDILKCVFSVVNNSPCNRATKNVVYHLIRIQVPSMLDDSQLLVDTSITKDFTSQLRCTLGVFGDPHLRRCWSRNLVTCSAPGEQTYISNNYFTITGTNVEIGREVSGFSRATTLRSLTITFKSLDGSSVIATYSATGGSLPKVFDNDRNVAGSGANQVEIHDDSYRVRFVQKSTGTLMTVRQWIGNYFFTVRAAENILIQSTGLLADGCPEDQKVTFDQFLVQTRRKKRSVSYADCLQACNSSLTEQDFVTSCTFDCLATENQQLALNMSVAAQEDVSLTLTFDNILRQFAAQDGSRSGASITTRDIISWLVVLSGSLLISTVINF